MIMKENVTAWHAEQNRTITEAKNFHLQKLIIIHSEFVPQGKTTNFEIYGQVLKGFVNSISGVRKRLL
jgi:hypothetical protein